MKNCCLIFFGKEQMLEKNNFYNFAGSNITVGIFFYRLCR